MDAENIAALEAELKHASAIAACSIGQPDRDENVAYREDIRAKLAAAQQATAASTNPEG